MQEAGEDEMSSKTCGDTSLCFSIEARVGEGPCGAKSRRCRKGGPEGDGESPPGWWDTQTGVELAIFGSKLSQNASEHVDIKVSECGGEARHEVELGTHEDASIRVEIDAGGIWGHKDIAL